MTGSPGKVDAFIDLMRELGVIKGASLHLVQSASGGGAPTSLGRLGRMVTCTG